MKTIAQQLNVKQFPLLIRNSKGQEIYWEGSKNYWTRREYDSHGNLIYFEDANGVIQDYRPKTEIQKAIELLTKEGLLVDGKILKQ